MTKNRVYRHAGFCCWNILPGNRFHYVPPVSDTMRLSKEFLTGFLNGSIELTARDNFAVCHKKVGPVWVDRSVTLTTFELFWVNFPDQIVCEWNSGGQEC